MHRVTRIKYTAKFGAIIYVEMVGAAKGYNTMIFKEVTCRCRVGIRN